MAEFNGKQGRWITTKDGRKVFLEDEQDKQEREIREREEQTKKLTAEKQPVDNKERIKEILAEQSALRKELRKGGKYHEDIAEKISQLTKEHESLLVKRKSLTQSELNEVSKWLDKSNEYGNIAPDEVADQYIGANWAFDNGIDLDVSNFPIEFLYNTGSVEGDAIGKFTAWEGDHVLKGNELKKSYGYLSSEVIKGDDGRPTLLIHVTKPFNDEY